MRLLYMLATALLFHSCAFRRIVRTKDVVYQPAIAAQNILAQRLNIFAPRRAKSAPVLIYIHGGNWTSGRRELYNFFGSRLARKGIVAVVIDYPLSPDVHWNKMAEASAAAAVWTEANIMQWGGDPRRIYVSGHSAGGHLASLISLTDAFYNKPLTRIPIKGTILIDAAGLDMYGFLKDQNGLAEEPSYATTFTGDTVEWKRATPLYYLHGGAPPMLIFRGGRTYPSIIRSNEKFVAAARDTGIQPQYILQPRRKHIPMITQFFYTGNPRYRDILRFMGAGQ